MQISFIHDFFRAEWDGGAAERSGRWLYALAAPLLRRLGHGTARIGIAHPGVQALLARALSLKRAGMTLRWPTLFSDPEAASQHSAILPYLSRAGLVVGFEISPNQMRILEAASIPFVDVAIDPIRFEADLFLALRTNDPDLADTLGCYAAPVARQACHLRHGPYSLTQNILFVGQTDVDAALVVEARLAAIHPYLPVLRRRFGSGRHLLLKPHPYSRTNRDILAMHRFFPEARIVNDNVYAQLASGTIAEVVTLSSGVATEAPFFGVPATSLLQPDTTHVDFVSPGVRVPPAAIWPGLPATSPRTGANRPFRHVSLRSRLGMAWAFPQPSCLPVRRVQVSDSLDFRDGSHPGLLGFGWSYPEATGRWTSGPLATFLVDTGGQSLQLALQCRPYCVAGTEPLRVKIEVRGDSGSAQHLTFHQNRLFTVVVRIPPAMGLVEVAIHISNPRSPASFGHSEDQRALGLHVTSMDVWSWTAAQPVLLPHIARAMAASSAAALIGG